MIIRTIFATGMVLLAGCQSFPGPGRAGRLEREISTIERRVDSIEAEISNIAAPISERTDGVYTHVSYRPIIDWAEAFSAGPEANRTITFRQTTRNGQIVSVGRRCRTWPPWDREFRAGYYAEIDESNSTRATLLIERFVVTPQQDGLVLQSPLRVEAKTQVKGQWRPPCTGSSIGTNVGVTGEVRPNTVFRLTFAGIEGNAVRYSLDLVSPDRIGVELRFHLNGLGRIGFTVPMEGLARQLSGGTIDLLLDKDGRILLPDGQVIGYRIGTVNPRLTSSTTGFQLSTDVNVSISLPPVSMRRSDTRDLPTPAQAP